LPPGSIIFEEISDEIIKGQILKPLERSALARHQSDPLPGRIRYRAPDHSEVEISFGDKDQKGDFTLRCVVYLLFLLYGFISILFSRIYHYQYKYAFQTRRLGSV
jgi:hypothetical protein